MNEARRVRVRAGRPGGVGGAVADLSVLCPARLPSLPPLPHDPLPVRRRAVAHLAPLALTRAASTSASGRGRSARAAVALARGGATVLHVRLGTSRASSRRSTRRGRSTPPPTGRRCSLRPLARAAGRAGRRARRVARDGEPARAFITPDGALLALGTPARPRPARAPDAPRFPTASRPSRSRRRPRLAAVGRRRGPARAYRVRPRGDRRAGRATAGRASTPARTSPAPRDVFLGPGATVRAGAVVDASDGPVWIGAGAAVESNAVVRGPVFLGEKTIVKALARVDGTAAGEQCRPGGEVHESRPPTRSRRRATTATSATARSGGGRTSARRPTRRTSRTTTAR